MNQTIDPLDQPLDPDRVYYAIGTLLSADDFQAEQTYHRGRLARALALLHGSGTVAGLKVSWSPQKPPVAGPPARPAQAEEIEVAPGVALDRLGRLIEIPRQACIRLGRWFDSLETDDLIAAAHSVTVPNPDTTSASTELSVTAIVADVFVHYSACERGKTPAFATGPFDALDAIVPARLRDGYSLDLVLRKEGTPPSPQNPWHGQAQLLDDILAAWDLAMEREEGHLKPLAEHTPGQNPTAVLLARVLIIVDDPGDGARPIRRNNPTVAGQRWVVVRNDIRPLVYPSGALARVAGL
jgi:hypothetical protein